MMLSATAGFTLLPAVSQHLDDAEARPQERYCSKRYHPKGCITVPTGSRRGRGVRPQDPPRVHPPEVVNGGGVGGPGLRERGAVDWASGFTGSAVWKHRDQRFVEAAYGTSGRFPSARIARRSLRLDTGSPASAPVGTLMLFRADSVNRFLGHIGISVGNGRMLSALNEVRDTDVAGTRYWKELYLGWSRAPSDWRGRLPLPGGLDGPIGYEDAEIVSPPVGEPVRGTVSLEATTAQLGTSLAFSAFYADDPANAAAGPVWHDLGRATAVGGTHVLLWDTTGVPDQGNPRLATVMIAAVVVDANGTAKDVGDFRRISVDNVP